MKKVFALAITLAAIALVLTGIMTAARAAAEGTTKVKFTEIEGRAMGNGRARIFFVLDKKTPLGFRNVTLTPPDAYGDIIVQNSGRDGKHWTVFILGLTHTRELTLTLAKEGYRFEPPSKTVKLDP